MQTDEVDATILQKSVNLLFLSFVHTLCCLQLGFSFQLSVTPAMSYVFNFYAGLPTEGPYELDRKGILPAKSYRCTQAEASSALSPVSSPPPGAWLSGPPGSWRPQPPRPVVPPPGFLSEPVRPSNLPPKAPGGEPSSTPDAGKRPSAKPATTFNVKSNAAPVTPPYNPPAREPKATPRKTGEKARAWTSIYSATSSRGKIGG